MDEFPQGIVPLPSVEDTQSKKTKWLIPFGVIFLLLLIGGSVFYFLSRKDDGENILTSTDQTPKRTVNVKRLATLDYSGNKSISAVTFTPQGRHYYYEIFDTRKNDEALFGVDILNAKLIVDGKESECSSTIPLVFSPNEEHMVCSVKKDNKIVVLKDGQEVAEKKYNLSTGAFFSPDSSRLALLIQDEKSSYIMIDGVKGKSYDSIFGFTFSPDSKRYAYKARRGHESLVIVDGEEGQSYNNEIGWLVFSPDSKQFAYSVQLYKDHFIVLNGIRLNPDQKFESVSQLVFSSDNNHWAYSARVVTTKLLSYTLQNFLIVNGTAQELPYKELYDRVYAPVFSPDGTMIAYRLKKGNRELVVVNGVEGKDYDKAWDPIFSPDSKHMAYVAQRGYEFFVVLDGVEGKSYLLIDSSYPTVLDKRYNLLFSPDSSKFAYTAYSSSTVTYEEKTYEGRKSFVVLNGTEGTAYYQISNLGFSADSKTLSYGAVGTVKNDGSLSDNDVLWVTETLE